MKIYADKHRSERKFEKGDWVYLKLQAYRQISVAGTGNHKLNPNFFGPFEVLQKVGTCAYRLNLPEGSSIHPVFHVSLLKARVGNDQAISPVLPLLEPQPETLLLSQAIIARRMVKKRNSAVAQVLIQWRGQEIEDATWEDYPKMVEKYPDFILEVEKRFKEGGMSDTGAELGVIRVNFDLVNTSEEGEGELGRKVQETGNNNVIEASLSGGDTSIKG